MHIMLHPRTARRNAQLLICRVVFRVKNTLLRSKDNFIQILKDIYRLFKN